MLSNALMLMGLISQAVGSRTAGFQAAGSYKAQAIAARNEGIEQKKLSDYRARLIYKAGWEMRGGIEAETAKSGLAMTGTPLASLVDTAREVELSASLEKRSGTMTKRKYDQMADDYMKAYRDSKKSGLSGMLGPLAGVAGLVLGGPWAGLYAFAGGSLAGAFMQD